MIFIDWGDVETSHRLQDGDVLRVTYEDLGDPGQVELWLVRAPHINWWKGLQLLDNTDGQIGFLEGQDSEPDAGPLNTQTVDIATGGKIVLWKAKAFGIHTPMYILQGMEHLAGKRARFRWSAQ
jgi:hypothetical protein